MPVPSSSLAWPVAIRRYLTAQVLQRAMEQHGSWQEVARWLYAGQMRQGARLPYAPSLTFLWPMIEEDAAAWEQNRKTANPSASPSEPSTQNTP